MISIIESLRSKQRSLPLTLELMISLIELDHTDEEIPDLMTLCHVLNETFETEFTEDEILFSTLSSFEEEDMRLQYKHLNIH